MKVLLIRPKPHKETIGLQHVMICEPLELEYLAANIPEKIENNIQVKIIDLIIDKRKYSKILLLEKPDFIVFTGYITHVGIIKAMAKEAKNLLPEIIVGVGGIHAEVVPDDFRSPFIDFVYNKNGIDAFNLTLEGLIEGKSKETIKATLDEMGPKREIFDYKHPDRNAVSQYRNNYYYLFHSPCALIKTSFGCPYQCSFCFCREITDGKFFTRDMEDVISELGEIKENEIYIVDDDFLFDVKRLEKFIEGLKSAKIEKKFLVYGRADFIASNREILERLKKYGLQAVIVGIESVRAKDLAAYHKKTTKAVNEECIKILKELDIELYATLIIPLDFAKKDFRELIKWLKDLNVRFVNLQPLTPLPGTEIFDEYLSKLIVKREDYPVWDMAHVVLRPEFMSIRSFYLEMILAYYKIVMRPKNVIPLIKKYGLKANIKLLIGSSFVTFQYIQKILRGY
jgi:hopanoid C-3 methylase